MRNALYQGNATKLINRLAELPAFVDVTEKGASPKHMKDRLIVLRFLAFFLWQEGISKDVETGVLLDYKSNIEDFLGKTMAYINSLDENSPLLKSLPDMFERTMENAKKYVLPMGGFRLQTKGKSRRPLNMSFFESLCYLIAKREFRSEVEASAVYRGLLSNQKYLNSITRSVDSRTQIAERYNVIKEYLDAI